MKMSISRLILTMVSVASLPGFSIVASAADSTVLRYSTVHATSTQFTSIMGAYYDSATANNDTLMCQAVSTGESLLFDLPLNLNLMGGYDSTFNTSIGMTSVNSLTIKNGSLTVSRIQLVPAICGNGLLENGEACDDGNLLSGDGCTSMCSIESGFYCSGSPSQCHSPCGDGYVSSIEPCDDGNLMNGDGCSSGCMIEHSYSCIGSPSVCELANPSVVSITPNDASTGVAVSTSIAVTFDSAMNYASITAQSPAGFCSGSLQVSTDNFATCIGMQTPALSQNTSGHTVATLMPVPALSYGLTYKVRVTSGATNIIGNGAFPYTMATGFVTSSPSDQCFAPGSVVISQIYGGGGNSGAPYKNDFIELHNNGPSTVSLAGWSVQYASATGTSWQVSSIAGGATIPPGGYYLIQEGGGSSGYSFLPTPDTVGSVAMGATAGKVALVQSTTTLVGSCPSSTDIIDLVGYGYNASCYKGTIPALSPSNTTAIVRTNLGCQNGGANATDFAADSPNPRNSASSANMCSYTVNECGTSTEADYCTITSPVSLNLEAGISSGNIYGQVYEASVTEPGGASSSITAQVGYGPVEVNPENQSGWKWFPAFYSAQAGTSDEYGGAFIAPATGIYHYTYRFSLDGGSHWTYCDLNGSGSNTGLTFETTQLPTLTVNR